MYWRRPFASARSALQGSLSIPASTDLRVHCAVGIFLCLATCAPSELAPPAPSAAPALELNENIQQLPGSLFALQVRRGNEHTKNRAPPHAHSISPFRAGLGFACGVFSAPDGLWCCSCAWTGGGAKCPKAPHPHDDGSECFCRCCCQYELPGFVCKWKPPKPVPPPPTLPPPPPLPSPPGPPLPFPPGPPIPTSCDCHSPVVKVTAMSEVTRRGDPPLSCP